MVRSLPEGKDVRGSLLFMKGEGRCEQLFDNIAERNFLLPR